MEGEAENPVFALAPLPLSGVTPGVSSLLGISVSISVKWEDCPRRSLKPILALTLHTVAINTVSLRLVQRSFMRGYFSLWPWMKFTQLAGFSGKQPPLIYITKAYVSQSIFILVGVRELRGGF